MRLKHVKGARELIEKHTEFIIDNTDNDPIDIESLFKTKQPIHIEIGMGKGRFIYTLAKENPSINFIGIEKYDSAIVKGLYKLLEAPLPNLYLLRTDAIDLTILFKPNTIDRVYLTFSDPWPKVRHEKRRLTHHNFLKKYQLLLKSNGELHFKTDNTDLFEYSVESIESYPLDVLYITRDLHQDKNEYNIMTEFEEKFSKKGIKIKKIIAKFKEDNNG